MRPRFLLFILTAAISTWLTGWAEEGRAENKVVRIAYVFPESGGSAPSEAFRERLRDLGWVEGKNLVLDQYWAAGHMDLLPDLMRRALARNPDILVTGSTPGALAAKKATTTVPIVVASMGDPVQSGVVTNMAKPGGNLTALSTGYADGFAGKWLELLLEVVPHATSVAVLWNTNNPVVLPYRGDLEAAARARGVKLNFIDVHQVEGLDSAFRDARRTAQAAVVVCENVFIQNVRQVVHLAAATRLPSAYCLSSFPKAGGLMSYGVDLTAMFRRAAEQVDKVLRGAKAGDLPVEQPNRYELVVNLRTAKSLGVTIPEAILSHADLVIR